MSFDQVILNSLPKIELHLHLDCSLSFDVVSQLQPGTSLEEYHMSFHAPLNSTKFSEVLACASSGIQLKEKRGLVEDITFTTHHPDRVISLIRTFISTS